MAECKSSLLRAISACDFAMWELQLYLDTHPNCRNAARYYNEHMEKRNRLIAQYQAKFGPLVTGHKKIEEGEWEWVNDPWPWERCFTEGK